MAISRHPPPFSLRKQHRHTFRILRFPHRSSHLLKYLYFPSSLNFLDITESKSHPVVRSARRAAPELARHVSRKHPHSRLPSHADVARLSEASERYVVCRLPRSTFHGNIRKICHSQTILRHISRKHPKGRPRRPRSAAQRTEASVRYVILRPLCGTAHGRFRKPGRQSDIYGTAHGNIRKLCRKCAHRDLIHGSVRVIDHRTAAVCSNP